MTEPESMLNSRVKNALVKHIDKEISKALDQGDSELAAEYAAAKKLVRRGCWTLRNFNPYIGFTEKCLLSTKGQTLEQTQQRMRECAEEWTKLTPKEKERYRRQEKDAYDYL